jgi:hypothetical protein
VLNGSAFDLPERLAAKADPALIAGDEKHFAAIAESLGQSIAEGTGRLEAERKAPARLGTKAVERDMEIHRLKGFVDRWHHVARRSRSRRTRAYPPMGALE